MRIKIIKLKVGSNMKFQKKHVIASALILALGAAVYVNWQFTSGNSTGAKELGAASYVNATAAATADQAKQTAAQSKEQMGFFAAERTKRQSTQDKVLDDAREILKLDDADKAELTEAQKNVEKILKSFTIQDSIESIIKAKGFSDCICCITDEGVSVIVPESELNDNSVLIIDDAVVSHYDVAYDKISIIGA